MKIPHAGIVWPRHAADLVSRERIGGGRAGVAVKAGFYRKRALAAPSAFDGDKKTGFIFSEI